MPRQTLMHTTKIYTCYLRHESGVWHNQIENAWRLTLLDKNHKMIIVAYSAQRGVRSLHGMMRKLAYDIMVQEHALANEEAKEGEYKQTRLKF